MLFDNLQQGKVSKRKGYLFFFSPLIEVLLYRVFNLPSLVTQSVFLPLRDGSMIEFCLQVTPYRAKDDSFCVRVILSHKGGNPAKTGSENNAHLFEWEG
jgi:hypothetical protein